MIEIEKRFQPIEEQIKALLEGAEFVGEVLLHDIYYDYIDYRLLKNDIRLRERNGSFELKIGKKSGVAEEIENEDEIAKYFGIRGGLRNFVKNELIVFMDFSNNRKSYKKDGFNIDIDKMSFGYEVCEIELLVEDENKIKEAEEKIVNFAKKYKLEPSKLLAKRIEYLKRFKPEIYKEVYEK